MAESTFTILEQLGMPNAKKNASHQNDDIPQCAPQLHPQSQPSPDVEQALLNILGPNASKQFTPMNQD